MSNSRKPNALKLIQGTDQPCREVEEIELPLVEKVPEAPDWLPNAHAVKEWNRLAPILANAGLLTEGGLSALALMCAIHGKNIQLFTAGETPTGHMIAQYRNLINDFGLTPVAQGKVTPNADKGTGNAFAGNGKKPPAAKKPAAKKNAVTKGKAAVKKKP